jgi:pimeloyl-ACP methyl ester carboxylesterase
MPSAAWMAAGGAWLALLLGGGCSDDPASGGAVAHGGSGVGGTAIGASAGFGGVGGHGAAAGGSGLAGGGGGGGEPPSDFREPGPYAVDVSAGNFQCTSGCLLDYDRYLPQGATWPGLVVASHGLECGRQHLADFARHWASWGLAVVAPDLCHSTTLDLNPLQNGLDVIELGASLSSGPVVYLGHSAGGLASLVAAAHDPDALASFGLDPAEWSGIGAAAVPAISRPAYAVIGVASTCNGWGNALPLYAAIAGARVLRVTEADHCDFSSPNSCAPCQLGCGVGTNVMFSNAEITATIRGLSTAFLLSQAGLDAAGAGWWAPGQQAYETLLAAGAISEP